VFGQLAVALEEAPFLPPMLPYPVLLASQIGLIAGLAAICRQFSRGGGYFVYRSNAAARSACARYSSPRQSSSESSFCPSSIGVASPTGW